jgi:hypothetical protein
MSETGVTAESPRLLEADVVAAGTGSVRRVQAGLHPELVARNPGRYSRTMTLSIKVILLPAMRSLSAAGADGRKRQATGGGHGTGASTASSQHPEPTCPSALLKGTMSSRISQALANT